MNASKVQQQHSLDEALDNLRADASVATWTIGYIKSIIGNKTVEEKIGSSYSGFAAAIANTSVTDALILYCTRSWDNCDDTISLPSITKILPSSQEIYDRRLKDFSCSPPNDLYLTVDKRRIDYFNLYNAALSDDINGSLRVIRTERLAHRSLNSRDRQKLEKIRPIKDATYNLLIARAEQTIAIVNQLDRLLNGSSNPYSERIENAEKYCREFWRLMPILGREEVIT